MILIIMLCRSPTQGSSMTASGMGAIGLAVTGGVFFNDLSNPDGSLALTNEVTSRHMSRVTLCDGV